MVECLAAVFWKFVFFGKWTKMAISRADTFINQSANCSQVKLLSENEIKCAPNFFCFVPFFVANPITYSSQNAYVSSYLVSSCRYEDNKVLGFILVKQQAFCMILAMPMTFFLCTFFLVPRFNFSRVVWGGDYRPHFNIFVIHYETL